MKTAEIIPFPVERTAEGRAFEAKKTAYNEWAGDRVEQGLHVPVYCDPENEFRGDKFEAGLDIKEIAKRIRKEIAAKKKAGEFPKELKVSVKISRYSGGQSMRATITAWPRDVKNPAWKKEYDDNVAMGLDDWNARQMINKNDTPFYDPELDGVIDKIKAMGDAYNRDNSDSMVDYFDVNFYWYVEVDWDLKR